MIDKIKDARSMLKDITMLPLDAQFPSKVKKVDNYIEEQMEVLGRASALSLLVYLSPATGEPMSVHVNNRNSQIRSMNETSTISAVQDGQKVSVSVNFLEDLIHDRENLVVTPGSNPIHVFAAAVEPATRYIPGRDIPDNVDNYLQTWISVDYQASSGPISQQKIVMTNQELRDVTVKDINQLHYILNIPHYYKNTTVPVGESPQPVVFFKYIFDKLRLMPLHDADLLRKFITNDLGLPLFPAKDYTLPIYAQWTRLSYFLQMCSPICLSPIEGGHRTLQMIKFFTGADFNNKTPQALEPTRREDYLMVEMRPSMNIQEHGLAMTTYNYSFWQRFNKNAPFDRQVAHELQLQSLWFKESLKVICKDTNDNFLVQVLSKLDALFYCEPEEQFTRQRFFCAHDAYFKLLDPRMAQAYRAILDVIKTVSPLKEKWEKLSEPERSVYEAPIPPKGAEPTFKYLQRSLVSIVATLVPSQYLY